jgi:hypothetical protein
MESKMEFNRDILGVIREFAGPRMRFVNEFAAVQREIREKKVMVPACLLRLVKGRLSGPNAEHVFQSFMLFVESERVLRSLHPNKISMDVLKYHGDVTEYLWIAVLQSELQSNFISFADFQAWPKPQAFNTDEVD